MHFLALALPLLAWNVQLADSVTEVPYSFAHYANPPVHMTDESWTRKEIGVVIRMTTEFLKDMDMKMRDVRRVEKYYYGTQDFGAGRIFSQIENKFEHMVTLYKNTSYIMRIMGKEIDLRSDVVGSLQFMLGDYMEMLGLIDMFKERYSLWRSNSDRSRIRDLIKRYLLQNGEQPTGYDREQDEWRRFASRPTRTSAYARKDVSGEDEDTSGEDEDASGEDEDASREDMDASGEDEDEYMFKYVGFDAWYKSLFDN